MIDEGAYPNYRDHSGNTPLHAAVTWKARSHIDSEKRIVAALLDAGIDPNIRNYDGLTAGEVTTEPALLKLLGHPMPVVSDEMIKDFADKARATSCNLYQLPTGLSISRTEDDTGNVVSKL